MVLRRGEESSGVDCLVLWENTCLANGGFRLDDGMGWDDIGMR